MEIKRDRYLNKLISLMRNGQVKVITGIRRCGKSYLLRNLFKDYLLANGVQEDHIFSFELDLLRDLRYRNPLELTSFVRNAIASSKDQFYLFVDEIQMSDEVANPYNPEGKKLTFYDALNDLRSFSNLDIYVTGSNSKMLSSDILTEFRGRSDEIRVHPLSFLEFYSAVGSDKSAAFDTYASFGGMPLILSRPSDAAKIQYLQSLFSEVYLRDIVERKRIKREDVLSSVVDLLCSSIGSLTNANSVANAINSKQRRSGDSLVAGNTIKSYMDYLSDAFLFNECKRFDIKGKNYFDFPNKYYCEDVGLRNARIGFRQQEMNHIMENIIYNDLRIRDCAVDVGVVYSSEHNDKGTLSQVTREIDFIVNSGDRKTYIQSAYALPSEEKSEAELKPFFLTGDFFPRIIVRRDTSRRWYDDNGILNINIIDFLLDTTIV